MSKNKKPVQRAVLIFTDKRDGSGVKAEILFQPKLDRQAKIPSLAVLLACKAWDSVREATKQANAGQIQDVEITINPEGVVV